jgi:hypothetical protein
MTESRRANKVAVGATAKEVISDMVSPFENDLPPQSGMPDANKQLIILHGSIIDVAMRHIRGRPLFQETKKAARNGRPSKS